MGYLVAKLRRLPSELVKLGTPLELAFSEYWIRKQEIEDADKMWYLLNRSLGTLWEKKDFESNVSKVYHDVERKTVWYPLSQLIAQIDIKKAVKKDFVVHGQQIGGGEFEFSKDEEIVNLSTTTTKEEFLDFLTKFGGALPGTDKLDK